MNAARSAWAPFLKQAMLRAIPRHAARLASLSGPARRLSMAVLLLLTVAFLNASTSLPGATSVARACAPDDQACLDDTTPPNVMPSPEDDFRILTPLNAWGSVEATGPNGAVVLYQTPRIGDLVDPNPTVVCSPVSGLVFPIGISTVYCVAQDAAGNTAVYQYAVTVSDTTAPNIPPGPDEGFLILTALNADGMVEVTSPQGAAVTYRTPTWGDMADPNATTMCVQPSGTVFSIGWTAVWCAATDASGNSAIYGPYYIAVSDTTAPSLPPPPGADFQVTSAINADGSVEATSQNGAVVTYQTPLWGDAGDPSPVMTCVPPSGLAFPIGTTTISCTATDLYGNSATYFYAITVVDTTAPNVMPAVPWHDFQIISATNADGSVEATSQNGAVVEYQSPIIGDLVDPNPTTLCFPFSGSLFPIGTSTVTCLASDVTGNSTSYSYAVTVSDTTAPHLPPPPGADFQVTSATNADGTSEATSPAGAVVTYQTPVWGDIADPSPVTTCVPASGSTFALGTTTVVCTATDIYGNSTSYSYAITVVDTTAPNLPPPPGADFQVTSATNADGTSEATSPVGAVVTYQTPVWGDIADPSPVTICVPASGSTFALGSTTVSCTATDNVGNSATYDYSIQVVDTTAPNVMPAVPWHDFQIISATNADGSVEATSSAGAFVEYRSPMIGDLVDPNPTTTCLPASGSVFPIGTSTVTCFAQDAFGNSATFDYAITVVDTTAPNLPPPAGADFQVTSATNADGTSEATSPVGAVVTYQMPVWGDIADPSPVTICVPASGSTFALGTTTVTCTATDIYGNSAAYDYAITVVDTTAPNLPPPSGAGFQVTSATNADGTSEATSPVGAVVTYQTPLWGDIADPSPVTICVPASGSTFPLGTTTVTCSATDNFGNTSTSSYEVEVVDTTAPNIVPEPGTPGYLVVTDPATIDPLAIEGTGLLTPVFYTPPVIGDLADPSPIVSCTPESGSAFPVGPSVIVCEAVDQAGNAATYSFPIEVVALPTTTTVSFSGPFIYTGSPFIASATVTAADGFSQSVTVVYSGDCLNAGSSCTAEASFSGAGIYLPSSGSASITILPAATTVTVTGGGTFTYDGTAYPLAATVTGPGGLNESVPIEGCIAAPTNVADSCTGTATYPGGGNYLGSSASDTVTILPAETTVTVTGGGTFTYDGTAYPLTATVTGPGGLNESVPVEGCVAAPTNVADSCTGTATYPGGPNHLGSSASDTVTILPAATTTEVSFGSGPFIFTGSAFTATAIVTPPSAGTATVSYTGDCTNGGTSCTATATYAGSPNYLPSSATASITITYALCPTGGRDIPRMAGSTVPVKMSVCGAGGIDAGSASLVVKAIGVSPSGSLGASRANPNGLFRFDDGQYIFNLNTRGFAAGSYTLNFTIGSDPTVYRAGFTLR